MAQTIDAAFVESPLFRAYFLYVSILAVKMLVMSPLTGFTRFKFKVSISALITVAYEFRQHCIFENYSVFEANRGTSRKSPIFIYI